jgi:hypothetical protein
MLHTDYLQVDGVHYFCDDKDYSTNADKDAKTVISAGRFTLSLLDDAIYNRNCGCGGEYLLRVINGWDASSGSSYKRIDKFNFVSNVFQITFRVSSIKIDGVEILDAVKSLVINAHTDLVISEGINGNEVATGTDFVQNVDLWMNELLENQDIRFYDSMSVVHFRKGMDFEIKIDTRTIDYAWDSGWDKYIYRNSGKTHINLSTTYPYVA